MTESGGVDRGRVRVGLLVARFNSMITQQLREGAEASLLEAGVAESSIQVLEVPGAWELPQAARRAADTGRFDALIAIGCVIRGDTAHFDYVAGEACYGLGAVARAVDIPVVFGVLTTENMAQAQERANRSAGNKGHEFATSALEMIDLYEMLPEMGQL